MRKNRIISISLITTLLFSNCVYAEVRDNTNIRKTISDNIKSEPSEPEADEITTTFTYTGAVEEYEVPCSGTYAITAYGAQGSDSSGKGTEVTTEVYLSYQDTLYVAVGGQGENSTGGYNGGGNGNNTGAGGGASSITTRNRGELKNFDNHTDEIMLVAGGGAGYGLDPVVINGVGLSGTTSGGVDYQCSGTWTFYTKHAGYIRAGVSQCALFSIDGGGESDATLDDNYRVYLNAGTHTIHVRNNCGGNNKKHGTSWSINDVSGLYGYQGYNHSDAKTLSSSNDVFGTGSDAEWTGTYTTAYTTTKTSAIGGGGGGYYGGQAGYSGTSYAHTECSNTIINENNNSGNGTVIITWLNND